MNIDQSNMVISSESSLPEICSYLVYGLFGHEDLKQQAIDRLNQLKESNPYNFIYEAIQEIINDSQTDLIKTILTIEIEHTMYKPCQNEVFISGALFNESQYMSSSSSTTQDDIHSCCWLAMDSESRKDIKLLLINQFNICEDYKTRKHLANVISSIAGIDLIRNEWEELITYIKELDKRCFYILIIQRILEKLQGNYPINWINLDHLETLFDNIIKFIHELYDTKLISACIKTLWSGLKLFKPILNNKNKFDEMINLLMDHSNSSSISEQRASIGCLSHIAYIYYEQLHEHMPNLIKILSSMISHHDEDITLRALDFWSNISLIEWNSIELTNDDQVVPNTEIYIRQAYEELIPMLLNNLECIDNCDIEVLKSMECKVFYESAMLLNTILDLINNDQIILYQFNFTKKIINLLPRFHYITEFDLVQPDVSLISSSSSSFLHDNNIIIPNGVAEENEEAIIYDNNDHKDID